MALCTNCGNDLFGGKVCYKCGLQAGSSQGVSQGPAQTPNQFQQPQQPQFQQPQFQTQFPAAQKTNGLAIASLVCSFFCGILGVIFGIIALNQINKSNGNGKGLAIAGICIGAASMIIGWLFWGSLFIAGSEY